MIEFKRDRRYLVADYNNVQVLDRDEIDQCISNDIELSLVVLDEYGRLYVSEDILTSAIIYGYSE